MSVQLKSHCPHCNSVVRAAESLLGKRVRCPACKRTFELLSVEALGGSKSLEQAPRADETLARPSSETVGSPARKEVAASLPSEKLSRLGRFEIKEILGQGAFGRVYKAYDPPLDRFVALKIPTFNAHDSHKVKRFITEAQSAARLRHPHIVPIYESGQIDGHYFIAAQFIEGTPLSGRIKTNPPDVRQAAEWVRQLADALAYAHGQGIVHRDIKPDNVMLDEANAAQLMDFGLAKRVNEDSTVTIDGSIMGTPAYMSPEQAKGHTAEVGPPSDLYSLGVVLYELLTGQKPFDGPPSTVMAQVIGADPPTPRSLRPEIPADLEAICLTAMSKDKARRHSSASQMRDDLAHWLAGSPAQACPQIKTSRNISRSRRRTWRMTAIAAVLLLIGGLATAFVVLWSVKKPQQELAAAKPAESRVDRQAESQDDAPSASPVASPKAETAADAVSSKPSSTSADPSAAADTVPEQRAPAAIAIANETAAIKENVAAPPDAVAPDDKTGNATETKSGVGQVLASAPRPAALPKPRKFPAGSSPDILTSDDWEWTTPENLGTAVNSEHADERPRFMADGLTLLFSSQRPHEIGAGNFWSCTRDSTSSLWKTAQNSGFILPGAISTPCITANGLLAVFFTRYSGNSDLYSTARVGVTRPWGTSVNLGPDINSTSSDCEPYLAADGCTLIFCSDRPGGRGGGDLWICTRSSVGQPWSKPVNLGPEINGPGEESEPWLTSDDLTLVFRTGGGGNVDLSMSTRAKTSDPWLSRILVGPNINSLYQDLMPCLSADNRTLVFVSNREGGLGDRDIWMSHRVPKAAIAKAETATNQRPAPNAAPPKTARFPPGSSAEVLTSDDWEWATPENLGPAVNSSSFEETPRLLADGLTLMFSSSRRPVTPAQTGNIWVSTWDTTLQTWSPAKSAQMPGTAQTPCFSANGLLNAFQAPGGDGSADLFAMTRSSINQPWGARNNLGSPVNSSGDEREPFLSGDGCTLVFASNRPGGLGNGDLWTCSRPSLAGQWSDPKNLGRSVNSPSDEAQPWLATDGLTLIYRVGGGNTDLFICTRSDTNSAWSDRVRMPTVNSGGPDTSPCLSTDNRMLFFGSNRPGGLGDRDIWMSRRVPKAGTRAAIALAATAVDALAVSNPALAKALQAAKAALADFNFKTATSQLAKAQSLANGPQQADMVTRLKEVAGHVEHFHSALASAIRDLPLGESLTIGDAQVGHAENARDKVVVRIGGESRTVALSDLSPDVAVALADRRLGAADPASSVAKGAYLLVCKQADERTRQQAKSQWEIAQAAGFNTQRLLPFLMDRYDLPAKAAPAKRPTSKPSSKQKQTTPP
jgi:serine/threonine protein kinase/Tol biopolymer transport system component